MTVARPLTPDLVVADAVASLEDLHSLTSSLDPEDWTRATDCPGWDVHDVVAHVVGFEAMLDGSPTPGQVLDETHVHNEIGAINQAWIESLRDVEPAALLDDLRALADRRRQELAARPPEDFEALTWSPVGEVPLARFLQIRTFDVWFHEQDVREATSRPGGLDGPVAERALTELTSALGYVVGKRGEVPDGDSVRFVLASDPSSSDGRPEIVIDVAVRGRARVVDDLEGDPTAVVETDLATFTRLAGGRRDPQELLDSGRVRISGDAELGDRVVRNLAYVI